MDQVVRADLGRVPIELHVALAMTSGGDVLVQAPAAGAHMSEQLMADNVGKLLLPFEPENQSGLSELALVGARFDGLVLLARRCAGTKPFKQAILLRGGHKMRMCRSSREMTSPELCEEHQQTENAQRHFAHRNHRERKLRCESLCRRVKPFDETKNDPEAALATS